MSDSDDADAYTPALPPDMLQSRPEASRRAVQGPSLPPPAGAGLPSGAVSSGEEEVEDIGPQLPTQGVDVEAMERNRRIAEVEDRVREASKPKKLEALQRPEWMTLPPTSRLVSNDPTAPRPRGFSSRAVAGASDIDNTLWTESPQERADRISGRGKPSSSGENRRKDKDKEDDFDRKRRRKYDEEAERVVRSVDKGQGRQKSLLEEHQERQREEKRKKRKGESSSESRSDSRSSSRSSSKTEYVPWDRDRDIGKMAPGKQKDIIGKMGKLGGKFGHGKSGRYI